MLPHSYELPAAILLVLGGALSCFAGYRLFKIVLAIYGFVLGAMLASSAMGVTNTTGMIVASLVGGVCGALLLTFAYFVGIALVGAGLGALIAHVAWSSVGKGGDRRAELPGADRVEPDRRLVDEDHRWIVEEATSDVQPLLHSPGVALGALLLPPLEPDQLEQRIDPTRNLLRRDAVQLR